MKSLFIVINISLFLFFIGCRDKEEVPAAKPPIISDSLQKSLIIDTVKLQPVEEALSLSGEVTYDDNKVVKLYPNASGQVVSVNVSLGDHVVKGQTLAVIKSADVAGNYADLQSASTDAAIAEKEFKNNEQLYKNGISSEKEMMQSKLAYEKALSAVSKVKSQIAINGGGRTSAGGTYVISAPRAGYIVEKNFNAGSFIRNDNSQNLFTISDMQDVWVLANVFETDIAKVKPGYDAEVTTISLPDKVFHGKVDAVNAVLDPASKAMKIKIVLPNTGLLLKPQMFAKVDILNQQTAQALVVPGNAIVFDGGKNYVLVYKNNNDVQVREVTVQKVVGSKTYISSGIQAGDKIISNNTLLVYNSLTED